MLSLSADPFVKWFNMNNGECTTVESPIIQDNGMEWRTAKVGYCTKVRQTKHHTETCRTAYRGLLVMRYFLVVYFWLFVLVIVVLTFTAFFGSLHHKCFIANLTRIGLNFKTPVLCKATEAAKTRLLHQHSTILKRQSTFTFS